MNDHLWESILQSFDLTFIKSLEEKNETHPQEVLNDWRRLIESGDVSISPAYDKPSSSIQENSNSINLLSISNSLKALALIRSYRVRGHLNANLDPLGLCPPTFHPELNPATYGLDLQDLTPIYLNGQLGFNYASTADLFKHLQTIYCGPIGLEFMHIQDPQKKEWIQQRFENAQRPFSFKAEEKTTIYTNLAKAEMFEKFLHVKFPGAKRFGLEGGESLIPALETILSRFETQGINEVVLGMAHRGRLSVLANVLGKPIHLILKKFQGEMPGQDAMHGSGDVKYHLGFSADKSVNGRSLHLSLTANPSHLEAVNPVVLGKVRAKQQMYQDTKRQTIAGILMHGDAAFAGQGLVAETLELSDLNGYRTGGTFHIIINNQIGFTTSPPHSRSSPYSSDIAKAIQAPIIHVNGDDPEAVCWAAEMAADYRHTFGTDVILDIICYRKHGHNESDEPSFTQPKMYKAIAQHPSTLTLFENKLLEGGVLSQETLSTIRAQLDDHLKSEMMEIQQSIKEDHDWLKGAWKDYRIQSTKQQPKTGVDQITLKKVGKKTLEIPEGFNIHPKIAKQWDLKRHMIESGEGIDWSTAEMLAFATLLNEGYGIRLSGQDCGRGTFSQRHAVLTDQANETEYFPLKKLTLNSSQNCEIINSPLAEASVLGFEYGYSTTDPRVLVMWEAQFGDFANGAQVIIDQFIAAGEVKWLRLSGLVMLLPHGYEGQGPEHSSARLERYLQLSAEDNWQVANCTTPANYFHILRRQLHRDIRKPLILMTPKSLLRHPMAISSINEMDKDTKFLPVIADTVEKGEKIDRIILCSGKVYYDLKNHAQKNGLHNARIVRIEEYFPFPDEALWEALRIHKKIPTIVWCQEEPANMGAWSFLRPYLETFLAKHEFEQRNIVYAGRAAAASTATGFLSRHVNEQTSLLQEAFTG